MTVERGPSLAIRAIGANGAIGRPPTPARSAPRCLPLLGTARTSKLHTHLSAGRYGAWIGEGMLDTRGWRLGDDLEV
jgi:hypothetical protein